MFSPRGDQTIALFNSDVDRWVINLCAGIERYGYEQAIADFTALFIKDHRHEPEVLALIAVVAIARLARERMA